MITLEFTKLLQKSSTPTTTKNAKHFIKHHYRSGGLWQQSKRSKVDIIETYTQIRCKTRLSVDKKKTVNGQKIAPGNSMDLKRSETFSPLVKNYFQGLIIDFLR